MDKNKRLVWLCTLFACLVSNLFSKDTVRLCVKNKKMTPNISGFMRPIYVDEQYYNVLDDDSYDGWEPARVLRDSTALLAYTKLWGKWVDAKIIKTWHKPSRPIKESCDPAVTWIGHSTFLIQYKNINIITDPVFGSLSWLNTRAINPGLTPNRLPHIDVILLSHNHTDHMDEESLLSLRAHQPLVMVPTGNAGWFRHHGFSYVVEYSWWECQELVLKDGAFSISITCVPALHASGRSVADINAALWAGWVISSEDKAVYFAGDTGYYKRLWDEIHTVFPSITIALLPIGPNEPGGLLNNIHMNAEQAVEAFMDLEAQLFIPSHWGTFRFGSDAFMLPIDNLKKSWAENNISGDRLHILKVGQRFVCQ